MIKRSTTARFALAIAIATGVGAAHAAEQPPASIAAALKAGAQQHKPVLLDFHAVWCYSCYYMAKHVLTGPDWDKVQQQAIVVDVDADSPDGHAWMDKLKVSFLPSYVVVDDKGNELGRISAEQPREKFYPQIGAILAHGNTLDQQKAQAKAGSLSAATSVLAAYAARNEGKEGLAWFAGLSPALRKQAATDPAGSLALDQLALAKAEQDKNAPATVAAAQKVLANAQVGCQRPYVLDALFNASEKLLDAQRKALLEPQRAPLQQYVDTQIFVPSPPCADQRSGVIASFELSNALGDPAAAKQVLDRAIAWDRLNLGSNLASDRNLADNLREYLELAKRDDELKAYEKQLIAAYPHDFVYTYRYARSLLAEGKPAEALPYFAQAYDAAYGESKLRVAGYQIKALKALHRDAEAKQIGDRAISENGQWFPKQAQQLRELLAS